MNYEYAIDVFGLKYRSMDDAMAAYEGADDDTKDTILKSAVGWMIGLREGDFAPPQLGSMAYYLKTCCDKDIEFMEIVFESMVEDAVYNDAHTTGFGILRSTGHLEVE